MPPVAAVEAKLKEGRDELQVLSRGAGANAGKRDVLTAQLFAAMRFEHPVEGVDPAYIAELEERLAIQESDMVEEHFPAPPSVHANERWFEAPGPVGESQDRIELELHNRSIVC